MPGKLLPPPDEYVLRLPVEEGGTGVGVGPGVDVARGVGVGPGPDVNVGEGVKVGPGVFVGVGVGGMTVFR